MFSDAVKFTPTESLDYPRHYEIAEHAQYVIRFDGESLIEKSTGKNVGQFLRTVGYKVSYVFDNFGEKKPVYVHRLMAFAFYGPEPVYENDIANVDHIDGNKLNNHYTNLEWVSQSENIRRAWQTGLCDDSKLITFVQNVYSGEETRYSSIAECGRASDVSLSSVFARVTKGPDRIWPGGLRYRTQGQVFKPMSKEEMEASLDSYKRDTVCFVLDVNTNEEVEYACLGDCAIALNLDKVSIFYRLSKGPDRVWPPGIRLRMEDEIFKEMSREETSSSLDHYFTNIPVIVQNVHTGEEIKYPSTAQCAITAGLERTTMHFRLHGGPDKIWPPGQRYRTEDQVFRDLSKSEIQQALDDYVTKISVYVQDVYTKEEINYVSISQCAKALGLNDETVRKRLLFGPDRVWTGGYRFRTDEEVFKPMTKEEVEASLENYYRDRKILVRWYHTDVVEQFGSVLTAAQRFQCQRKTICTWCEDVNQPLYGTIAEPFQIQFKEDRVPWREISKDEASFYSELEKTHKLSIIVLDENWKWIDETYPNLAACVKVYDTPRTTMMRYLGYMGERLIFGKRFMKELDYYKLHKPPDWLN